MTKGTKAVVIAVVAVVAGVLAGLAISQLASPGGDVEVRLGDDEFNAGFTEVLARTIDEGDGQPLIFNDVSGGDRDIYVQHVGEIDAEGWTAFETRIPGDDECFAEWDLDAGEFRSTCDAAVTFPADGEGLTQYPVEVTADARLVVDLR